MRTLTAPAFPGGAKALKRRLLPALLAAAVCLLALAGCAADATPAPPDYEGVWYFAQNAAECQIAQGKIYEDDYQNQEGQSLRGIYSDVDGHLEAHLRGVGGVRTAHGLYVAQTDDGEVLRDSDGTVYFYRDALEALEALERAETAAVPSGQASSPADGGTPPPTQEPASPAPPEGEPAAPSPEPQANTADIGAEDMVWIPQSGSKYHRNPGCSGMKDPSQVTRAQAESQGYAPCKRCY